MKKNIMKYCFGVLGIHSLLTIVFVDNYQFLEFVTPEVNTSGTPSAHT